MKWYIGYLAELVTFIGYVTYASQTIESNDLGNINFSAFIIAALIAGFMGGFLAPYHVSRTTKYGASTFALIAGIPAVIFFIISGDILSSGEADFGAVIILIVMLGLGIALVILIIIVSVLLTVGGIIGSVFGKSVFSEDQYDGFVHIQGPPIQAPIQSQFIQSPNQGPPMQSPPAGDFMDPNSVNCPSCNTTQKRTNFCVGCGYEFPVK